MAYGVGVAELAMDDVAEWADPDRDPRTAVPSVSWVTSAGRLDVSGLSEAVA